MVASLKNFVFSFTNERNIGEKEIVNAVSTRTESFYQAAKRGKQKTGANLIGTATLLQSNVILLCVAMDNSKWYTNPTGWIYKNPLPGVAHAAFYAILWFPDPSVCQKIQTCYLSVPKTH